MYTLKQLEPPYGIRSQLSSYPQFKSTCRRHRERRRPQELQAIKQHTDTEGELLGLKEWAVTVEALRHGEQTILLRKGGIRESAFDLQAKEFVLIPNTFHSDINVLKPIAAEKYKQILEFPIDYKAEKELLLHTMAEVTGLWTTTSEEALLSLNDFHVWTKDYVQNRLGWRPKQPVSILEVQCSTFSSPVIVENDPKIWGCFSFAKIPAHLPEKSTLMPVLAQEEVWARQKALRASLHKYGVHTMMS